MQPTRTTLMPVSLTAVASHPTPCRAQLQKRSVPVTKNIPPDVSAYCLTRSHSANPLKGSSTALTLRCGRGSQAYGACAPSADGVRDRGSLAALPAPAPLANTISARLAATVTALRARESRVRHLGGNAPDADDGQVHPTFNLKENIMFDLDHSEVQSSTATVCEYAALYGATPQAR